MRLLLILALLLSSLAFAQPAGAHADHQAAAPHHSHAGHEDGQDGAAGQAVAHICPGCAVVGAAAAIGAAVEPPALPERPANPPALASFDAHPIPPPPRSA